MLDKPPQVSTILTKHKGDRYINHNANLIVYGKSRNVNQTRKFVSAHQYILCSLKRFTESQIVIRSIS